MTVETTVPQLTPRASKRAPYQSPLPEVRPPAGATSPLYRADLPGEDELPDSDGEPMETWLHVLQMYLLTDALQQLWSDRDDFFVGGNMFLYFDPEQIQTRKFRGPDVFVVLGVPRGLRKSWVVWKEGKGPDVVIELLSRTTARIDRGRKKQIYQDEVKVPGYFYYHPNTRELAGFQLREGEYVPVEFDAEGRLPCEPLGLMLVRWKGCFHGVESVWLRWALPDGSLVLTEGEAERMAAEAERARADAIQERADAIQERADIERARAVAERARADALAARLRELGVEP